MGSCPDTDIDPGKALGLKEIYFSTDICEPCLLRPCLNGGECIPKGEERICICKPPYLQPDCNGK